MVVKIVGTAADTLGRTLLALGPSTATEVAAVLGLSGAAVRKSVDALVEAGLVEATDRAPYGPAALNAPRGRGRPAKVFSLTAAGREAFGDREDSLAVTAVKYLAEVAGEQQVAGFAQHIAEQFEARHRDISRHATVEERAQALAAALDADGYATVITPGLGESTQICQHHCPVGDIAVEFPTVCDAETEAFSRLTGVHVTRLATIAKGSPVCTTLVPHSRREAV